MLNNIVVLALHDEVMMDFTYLYILTYKYAHIYLHSNECLYAPMFRESPYYLNNNVLLIFMPPLKDYTFSLIIDFSSI